MTTERVRVEDRPDPNGMTLDEITAEQNDLDAEMAKIQAQIDQAHAVFHTTGERSDGNWLWRAKAAKRHMAARFNALNRARGAKRRASKPERTINDHFVDTAKERLREDLFASLLSDARARLQDERT